VAERSGEIINDDRASQLMLLKIVLKTEANFSILRDMRIKRF
jgi:hypothetical protein